MPKGKRHYRVTLKDAHDAHDAALLDGGLPGVISPHLLEAAVARPYMGYYRRIWQKAAALFESVCCNHCFADGNKRTAVLLLCLLLEKSGYELMPLFGEDINDAIENFAVAAASGELSLQQMEAWLRERITRSDLYSVYSE